MRIFLIDYENVNSCGLAGISRLNAEDRVILFYSQSANTLNFDILDEIMQSPVRTEKVNLNQSGKNALDFQLVTYLGYLIARQEADDFYIISRDMGYVATQQFCKKMLGVKVQIKPSIRDALTEKTSVPVKKMTVSQPVMLQQPVPAENKPGKKKKQKKQPKQITVQAKPAAPTVKIVRKLLMEIDPEIQTNRVKDIIRCMTDSESTAEFHNTLQRQFGGAEATDYYRGLKKYFADMQEQEHAQG